MSDLPVVSSADSGDLSFTNPLEGHVAALRAAVLDNDTTAPLLSPVARVAAQQAATRSFNEAPSIPMRATHARTELQL